MLRSPESFLGQSPWKVQPHTQPPKDSTCRHASKYEKKDGSQRYPGESVKTIRQTLPSQSFKNTKPKVQESFHKKNVKVLHLPQSSQQVTVCVFHSRQSEGKGDNPSTFNYRKDSCPCTKTTSPQSRASPKVHPPKPLRKHPSQSPQKTQMLFCLHLKNVKKVSQDKQAMIQSRNFVSNSSAVEPLKKSCIERDSSLLTKKKNIPSYVQAKARNQSKTLPPINSSTQKAMRKEPQPLKMLSMMDKDVHCKGKQRSRHGIRSPVKSTLKCGVVNSRLILFTSSQKTQDIQSKPASLVLINNQEKSMEGGSVEKDASLLLTDLKSLKTLKTLKTSCSGPQEKSCIRKGLRGEAEESKESRLSCLLSLGSVEEDCKRVTLQEETGKESDAIQHHDNSNKKNTDTMRSKSNYALSKLLDLVDISRSSPVPTSIFFHPTPPWSCYSTPVFGHILKSMLCDHVGRYTCRIDRRLGILSQNKALSSGSGRYSHCGKREGEGILLDVDKPVEKNFNNITQGDDCQYIGETTSSSCSTHLEVSSSETTQLDDSDLLSEAELQSTNVLSYLSKSMDCGAIKDSPSGVQAIEHEATSPQNEVSNPYNMNPLSDSLFSNFSDRLTFNGSVEHFKEHMNSFSFDCPSPSTFHIPWVAPSTAKTLHANHMLNFLKLVDSTSLYNFQHSCTNLKEDVPVSVEWLSNSLKPNGCPYHSSKVTLPFNAQPQNSFFNLSYETEGTRRPVAISRPENTLIIWDWDDTILPTYHLAVEYQRCFKDMNITYRLQEQLRVLEDKALRSLCLSIRNGCTILVTNASFRWLIDSAVRYLPRLWQFICSHRLKILSARDICQPLGLPQCDWKRLLIRDQVDLYFEKLVISSKNVETAIQNLPLTIDETIIANCCELFNQCIQATRLEYCFFSDSFDHQNDETHKSCSALLSCSTIAFFMNSEIPEQLKLDRFSRCLAAAYEIPSRLLVMTGVLVSCSLRHHDKSNNIAPDTKLTEHNQLFLERKLSREAEEDLRKKIPFYDITTPRLKTKSLLNNPLDETRRFVRQDVIARLRFIPGLGLFSDQRDHPFLKLPHKMDSIISSITSSLMTDLTKTHFFSLQQYHEFDLFSNLDTSSCVLHMVTGGSYQSLVLHSIPEGILRLPPAMITTSFPYIIVPEGSVRHIRDMFPSPPSLLGLCETPCSVVSIGDGQGEREAVLASMVHWDTAHRTFITHLDFLRTRICSLYASFIQYISKKANAPCKIKNIESYSMLKDSIVFTQIQCPYPSWTFKSLKLKAHPSVEQLSETHDALHLALLVCLHQKHSIDASVTATPFTLDTTCLREDISFDPQSLFVETDPLAMYPENYFSSSSQIQV